MSAEAIGEEGNRKALKDFARKLPSWLLLVASIHLDSPWLGSIDLKPDRRGGSEPAQRESSSLRVAGEFAGRIASGEANTALGPAAGQNGATGLGAGAGQEAKLTDPALL